MLEKSHSVVRNSSQTRINGRKQVSQAKKDSKLDQNGCCYASNLHSKETLKRSLGSLGYEDDFAETTTAPSTIEK